MLGEKECYEFYIGYANVLYNRARYEEAIKMYNKVIKLKPNLVNAQASLAFIYEYCRIEKSKSTALAKQILEKDSSNMYAEFILARN
jgi:tetratricopeptide (TPR) repeat protein